MTNNVLAAHHHGGGGGLWHTLTGWLTPLAGWLAHEGVPAPLSMPAAAGLAAIAVIVVLRLLASLAG